MGLFMEKGKRNLRTSSSMKNCRTAICVLQLELKHRQRLLNELKKLHVDRSQNFLFMVKMVGFASEILMKMIMR